jgi:hypothetical protein
MPEASRVPDVSVLIPAWNAAGSIAGAIASALHAPPGDVEVVVVDDASTDGTGDLVAAIAAADPRVVLVRQPENAGVSAARNAGLQHVHGTWLTLLDADDRFLPGGVAALHRAAISRDALAVVGQQVWSNGRHHWIGRLYDIPDIRTPRRTSLAASPGLLYHASPHAKLFRRSMVEDLRFEGRVLGDQPWVLRGLLRAGDRLEVIGEDVYEWVRTPPPGAGPSITTATRSSIERGVEAAGVATRAHAEVTAEAISLLGDGDAARRLAAAYADRLLRSDLAAHLDRALARRDPAIGRLFEAIERFLAALPAGLLAGSDALARDIVEPPLRRWPSVAREAHAAFWAMAATALEAQPDLAAHAGPAAARWALRHALRPGASGSRHGATQGDSSPHGATRRRSFVRRTAIAVLIALQLARTLRHGPGRIAAIRRRF